MPPVREPVPASITERAAAVARGPHACPWCEAPTWTEPPVPWTELRDFVVRCDACERPVAVQIDRDAICHPRAGERSAAASVAGMVDPVTELLERRGVQGVARRAAAALVFPLAVVMAAAAFGAGPRAAFVAALVSSVPGALWGPAAVALALGRVRSLWARFVRARVRASHRQPVTITGGRWDQWSREERRRRRECADQPEAVLEQLARVLDERELHRVRTLAAGGAVPADHLQDLLRWRRGWRSVA